MSYLIKGLKVSNDKYFDLSVKNCLIPYGIIIVLMEGSHFDHVFKLHDSISPIIPAGNDKIHFFLPFLKISQTLWSSLSTDIIKRHNTDLMKSGKMDINEELNFWFDHHTVMDKKKKNKPKNICFVLYRIQKI